MTIKVVVAQSAGPQILANLDKLRERMRNAISAAANMIGGMMLTGGQDAIVSGGLAGRIVDALGVGIDSVAQGYVIYFTSELSYLGIFATGGTIHGNPLLWIPISGTDAVGTPPSAYGGLFSSSHPRRDGGPPLLFSVADGQPRYFGTESVTIPQKFDLNGVVNSVLANYRMIFDSAWGTA